MPEPDVKTCTVVKPEIDIVPLTDGKVTVTVPATAGADSVTAPLVSPFTTTLAISFLLYWITQREPDATVTAAPPETVIGPADIPEKPAAIV